MLVIIKSVDCQLSIKLKFHWDREKEMERRERFLHVCCLDTSSKELWEDSCEHCEHVLGPSTDNIASFDEDPGNTRFYLYIQGPRFSVPLNSPNQGTIQSNVNTMINTENKLGVLGYLLFTKEFVTLFKAMFVRQHHDTQPFILCTLGEWGEMFVFIWGSLHRVCQYLLLEEVSG